MLFVTAVQFFDIITLKSCLRMLCFVHFDLEMRFSLRRHAIFRFFFARYYSGKVRCTIFRYRNFKKWSELGVFCTLVREYCVLYILISKYASRFSGVQFLIFPLNRYLRTRHFTEVIFRPSPPTNH